jgi:hypothetical protein
MLDDSFRAIVRLVARLLDLAVRLERLNRLFVWGAEGFQCALRNAE